MEVWSWLLAYVVGFALIQLLLYRYFQRDDPSPDATPGGTDGSARRSLEQSSEASTEAGARCPHCGAVNEHETTVAYCKECIRPLR